MGLAGSPARRRSTATTSATTSPAPAAPTRGHLHPERATAEDPRLHLRGAGRRRRPTAEPITHAGRFAHESVAWDPKRGALYLSEDNFAFPSGFYKYVPPQDPSRPAACSTAAGLHAQGRGRRPTPTWPCTSRTGRRFDVEWVEIDQPYVDFGRTPPGRRRRRPTTRRSSSSAARAWPRARPSSPGSRARSTTAAGSTSPRPRAAGPPSPTQPDTVGGFGKGCGQIWGYDTRAQKLHMLFESPEPGRPRLPGQRDDQRRAGTLIVCEDGDQRQLPAWPHPQGRALRHRPEQDQPTRHRSGRRVRRVDVQPRRRARCSSTSRPPSGCPSRSGGPGAASASDRSGLSTSAAGRGWPGRPPRARLSR